MFENMFESANTPLHSMLILNISLHYIAFLFDSYFHLSEFGIMHIIFEVAFDIGLNIISLCGSTCITV